MSSKPGRRSRSRSRESRDSRARARGRKSSRSRSRSSSSHSSSSSRSRSSRKRARRSRSRSPQRPVMSKIPKYVNARVFVANLPSAEIDSIDLEDIFKKHGKIIDCLVHHNGYGFVQFVNEEDARKAVAAEQQTMLHGKHIRCKLAAEENKRNGGNNKKNKGRGRGNQSRSDDRAGKESSRDRDHFRPSGGFSALDRELPPPPRDPRDLLPRHRDPRDLMPPRDPRDMLFRDVPLDLPLPPRDPFFDDPYRRFPVSDPYLDRFRDAPPFRRDPYGDPFRDPFRDPFAADPLLDPVPKKPMAVDCEIVIMTSELRRYADVVEKRLKDINLLTNLVVIREDRTIQEQLEDASRRSCLFAIVINSQNEKHRSITVNILHGVTQEHRNMPLDDAVPLITRSFEKFLKEEKEKVAAQNKEKSPPENDGDKSETKKTGPKHPKDIGYLLNLLADNQTLSVEEIDKVIGYLNDKKDKMLGIDRKPVEKEVKLSPSPAPQQPPPQQLSQPSYQQPSYEVQQQPSSYGGPPQSSNYQQPQPYPSQQPPLSQHQPTYPSYNQQQQQPQLQQHQQQPQLQQHQQQPQLQPQQHPYPQPNQQPTQNIQDQIMNILNGGSSVASTNNSIPQNTLSSDTSPLLLASMAARPPPPPPPPPEQPAPSHPLPQGPAMSQLSSMSPAPSGAGVSVAKTSAPMINLDNPTVQKALDNLIQSGSSLLKNISASVGQSSWSGQGTVMSTSQGYMGQSQRPPM